MKAHTLLVGEQIGKSQMGEELAISSRAEGTHSLRPGRAPPRSELQRYPRMHVQGDVFRNVHGRSACHREELRTAEMSIRMNKLRPSPTMEYYTAVKNEWVGTTCNNMSHPSRQPCIDN